MESVLEAAAGSAGKERPHSEAGPGWQPRRPCSALRRELRKAVAQAKELETDALLGASTAAFERRVLALHVPEDLLIRFDECVRSGEPTSEADQEVIAGALVAWAEQQGALQMAHWFFPLGHSGAGAGVLKHQPMCLSKVSSLAASIFQRELDCSPFFMCQCPCSGASVASWDRSSKPFVLDGVLRVPSKLTSADGLSIDDKIPVLRSMDAVQRGGRRLVQALGLSATEALTPYVSWAQDFFIVPSDLFSKRPDLVNCGHTLFGQHMKVQASVDSSSLLSGKMEKLLSCVTEVMLRVGCPMTGKQLLGPGQIRVMTGLQTVGEAVDSNALLLEVLRKEASKLGLEVLPHEEPFEGLGRNMRILKWTFRHDTATLLDSVAEDFPARAALAVAWSHALAKNCLVQLEMVKPAEEFEFWMAGGAQSCAFEVMSCNGILASVMSELADLITSGLSQEQAVETLKASEADAECGMGPLVSQGILSLQELQFRKDATQRKWNAILQAEVKTLVQMLETGILPACAKDLAQYQEMPKLAAERRALYELLPDEIERLESMMTAYEKAEPEPEADKVAVQGQLRRTRTICDKVEGLLGRDCYPYPTLKALLHFNLE